ncbi:MAG: hypothetical protein QNJ70_15565 [Xenococcaceae cyanobacterium MO_207.B15]|nr:hypothetical protein [Xenococcaceae cyanobacterium MO_207.B15]
MYLTETRELIRNLPGLVLAINKMLDKQEKDYGCFQIKKEEDFCSLYIPSFPSFKLYQNPRSHVYKGYWQTSDILPDIKDRNKKPQIYIKKKQKQVTNPKNIRLVKKQPIYEVIYKYDPTPEIRLVNRLIATCLKEKIEASISSVPENEIMPLVLITEDITN